jgi:hypothetical protein
MKTQETRKITMKRKKPFSIVPLCIAIFVALIACSSTSATQNGVTQTSQEVPTQQAIIPTPSQGPPLSTIKQIEKEIATPYDPIIEAYDQPAATVQVAYKFGTAIVVGAKNAKGVVEKHMRGYFDTHKEVFISSVTVHIYGTVRRGTTQNGYDVIARATMTRESAQSISWFFANSDDVWNKCTNTWMDQGVIEN